MTRLRLLLSLPGRGLGGARGLLTGITAQELTLAGALLVGLQFGWGAGGIVLVLLGLGLSLEWTERVR